MSAEGRRWLGKRVRVGAASDPSVTLAEGVVIGYAAAPTITVRERGRDSSWMVTLPIDVLGEVPDDELPEGFCTCEPGLPMRDCGMAGHREVARLLRRSGQPVDTGPELLTGIREVMAAWLASSADDDRETLNKIHVLLSGGKP